MSVEFNWNQHSSACKTDADVACNICIYFVFFREIADEEVDHLFAASDDDHDNRLSHDEIIDHHDIFVGSDVTDYGDHLHNLDRFTDEL